MRRSRKPSELNTIDGVELRDHSCNRQTAVGCGDGDQGIVERGAVTIRSSLAYGIDRIGLSLVRIVVLGNKRIYHAACLANRDLYVDSIDLSILFGHM